MLVDANLWVQAFDTASPFHERSSHWLTALLESGRRGALPAQSLAAFVRIVTHPKITTSPIDPVTAARAIRNWLDVPGVRVPTPGPAHGQLFCDLIERYHLTGNLVSGASLAALALEHGLPSTRPTPTSPGSPS